jgi:uncharacterized protein (DUF58 family)
MINRHLVRDWMLQLAAASPEPVHEPAGHSSDLPEPANPRAATFLAWLRSHDYQLPDEVDTEIAGAHPDLIYRLRDGSAAVFVTTGSSQEPGDGAERDEEAKDDLRDLGWSVITVGGEETWAAATARYPSVFGAW